MADDNHEQIISSLFSAVDSVADRSRVTRRDAEENIKAAVDLCNHVEDALLQLRGTAAALEGALTCLTNIQQHSRVFLYDQEGRLKRSIIQHQVDLNVRASLQSCSKPPLPSALVIPSPTEQTC